MSVIQKMTVPATFCAQESRLFWQTKGKKWWHCGKILSAVACRALIEDAFGGEEHIDTFCSPEERRQFLQACLPQDDEKDEVEPSLVPPQKTSC
ncbi:MAG: hypothetical protein CSA21_01985 [Deltaproteobacteria bacterium]|nr:MAG: hypothetical protein CSA21_01985 [Deltaproteobacteria bacterium]